MLSCSCSSSYSCPEAMFFYFGFGARAKERVRNTKRARTDPKPQSASCFRRKIKSQRKATAVRQPPDRAVQKKSPARPPRNRPLDPQILCTSICQLSPQKLQRRYRPGPSTLSPNLWNSESCEECLKQRLKILLPVTAGASCRASADAKSNFIMTRAGALSCSCTRIDDPGLTAAPLFPPGSTIPATIGCWTASACWLTNARGALHGSNENLFHRFRRSDDCRRRYRLCQSG